MVFSKIGLLFLVNNYKENLRKEKQTNKKTLQTLIKVFIIFHLIQLRLIYFNEKKKKKENSIQTQEFGAFFF